RRFGRRHDLHPTRSADQVRDVKSGRCPRRATWRWRRKAKDASASEFDADLLRKVLMLDGLVGVAGACFERRTIEDGNAAAAIADDAAPLQLLGEQRHRGAPHAEHFTLSDSSPHRVRHRKQEGNKNRACVRYRADLLLRIRIMPNGWPRFSIAALTPAFVFKATLRTKQSRAITTLTSR